LWEAPPFPCSRAKHVDLGKAENAFSPPLFSADNKKVAYISFQKEKNKEAVAVVEGDWNDPAPVTVKYGPEFDWVREPVFSPDGNILAYPAGDGTKTGKRMFLVVGGKKVPNPPGLWLWATNGFDWVGYPAFSPDGSVVAYVGRIIGYRAPTYIAVIGDKKSSRYDRVGRPIFSPDGATVAYSVLQSAEFLPDKRPKHGFVVVGNKQGPKFDSVWEPVFSPDGSSVAYPAKQNEKLFIVFGDKKGPEFDNVGKPVFSLDGHTVAYQAKQSQKQCIMVGDKRGPEFDQAGEPVFSPDGTVVAYSARQGNRWITVVGDKHSPEYDDASHPYFNSDGSKVAYGARQGREFWWKVMDVR